MMKRAKDTESTEA